MTQEQLMDPQQCRGCHPMHYEQWASSMHAYAADDPVFIAMNQRGQRETNGELGDFCLQCHAPMAVRTNLPNRNDVKSIPTPLKGVTCYFCHNATGHSGENNAQVDLAGDAIMRGPVGADGTEPPVNPGVHGVAYSKPHDPAYKDSADFCGSCHDVVTPAGVHMERTLQEYNNSLFSLGGERFQSCQGCHMKSFYDPLDGRPIATPAKGQTLPARTMHEHLWHAVDIALTDDWPNQEAMRKAVACELKDSLTLATVTPDPVGTSFKLYFETQAGHAQPSGASQDRRMWAEAIGYDAQGNVIFESGNIADGEVEQFPEGQPGYDPQLLMMRDHVYDAEGKEVHMFWEAAPSEAFPDGYKKAAIAETSLQNVKEHGKSHTWQLPVPPARFTVRIRLRPMGIDVLQSLVDSGDLDPTILTKMPTYTIREAEWKAGDGPRPIDLKASTDVVCAKDYACIFDPTLDFCK